MILLAKRTVTTDYQVEQYDRVINADTTGGPITVTLPPHAGRGAKITILAQVAPYVNTVSVNIGVSAASANGVRTLDITAGETVDDLVAKMTALFPEALWTQPGGLGTDIEGVYNEKAFVPIDGTYTPVTLATGGLTNFQLQFLEYGQDPIEAYVEYDLVNTGTDVLTLAASAGDTLQGTAAIPAGEARKVVSFGDGGWYIVGGGAGGGTTTVNLEERFNFDSNLDTVRILMYKDAITVGNVDFDTTQLTTVSVEVSLDGITWVQGSTNIVSGNSLPANIQTWINANGSGVIWYFRFTANYDVGKIGLAGLQYIYTR